MHHWGLFLLILVLNFLTGVNPGNTKTGNTAGVEDKKPVTVMPDQQSLIGKEPFDKSAGYLQIIPAIDLSKGIIIMPTLYKTDDFNSDAATMKKEKPKTDNPTYNYKFFEADNINLQYTGRIDFSNPKIPRFWSPGVYIKARYQGSFCIIAINDQLLWGNSNDYISGLSFYCVQSVAGYLMSDISHTILKP